ncbi:hypothetical protein SAMN04490191_2197 [Pseudomonas lini]|uniref:Uncharacterized protein n=1 Tax=Pseudomonas lini TaxID=163011 RepID=A0A1H1UPX8_9PSED|nr:hypothetical protein SAMN04490191_2197 [Pseudomonas lini]
MIKDNPDLPETDVEDVETNMENESVSPYACLNSKKLHDAAIRALDHYLAPPSQKKAKAGQRPSTIFVVVRASSRASLAPTGEWCRYLTCDRHITRRSEACPRRLTSDRQRPKPWHSPHCD